MCEITSDRNFPVNDSNHSQPAKFRVFGKISVMTPGLMQLYNFLKIRGFGWPHKKSGWGGYMRGKGCKRFKKKVFKGADKPIDCPALYWFKGTDYINRILLFSINRLACNREGGVL